MTESLEDVRSQSRIACALALVFMVACAKAEPAQKAPQAVAPEPDATQTVTLSIVGINDLHGHMQQLPRLGGYVNNLRAARERDHGAVLLLDAGDIFQGTLESNLGEGAGMIRAENALGVTAAALGNHEFDFGPLGPHAVPLAAGEDPLSALSARVHEAHFPFLSANLYAKDDDNAMPVPGVRRSLQLTAAGVRVGLIGAMTSGALAQTHADNTRGVTVDPLTANVAREASALRAAGAQVVIAVVHAGGECRDVSHADDLSSCDDKAEIFALAHSLPVNLVDAIVAGHTHAGVAQRVAGIPIIESYANAHAFGRVDVRIEVPSGHVLDTQIMPPHGICGTTMNPDVELPATCPDDRYEGAPVVADAHVAAAITEDLARAKSARDETLGITLQQAIPRALKQESALGNFVADAMLRAVPKADAAFNNGGSLRTGLPAGPVDFGHVFELFPFDNVLATLHMRASELASVVRNNLGATHGILSLAGLRARAHCDGDQLRVEILRPSGARVPDATRLTVVTSDYVATGGEGLLQGVALQAADVMIRHDRLVRDAIVAGLRAAAKNPPSTSDLRLFDPARPRIAYPGMRPVQCSVSPTTPKTPGASAVRDHE